MRPILGIETSCDETASAIVDDTGCILGEVVQSQLKEHAPFKGVVPEIAARAHLRYLPDQIRATLRQADLSLAQLAGVAATAGPGLIGGLVVGGPIAKGSAIGEGRPFIAACADGATSGLIGSS